MHLTNWKARRAGGRITVNALDAEGKQAFDERGLAIKIVGVDVMEPHKGLVRATDKNGEEHTLAV